MTFQTIVLKFPNVSGNCLTLTQKILSVERYGDTWLIFLTFPFLDEKTKSGLYESLPMDEVNKIDQILDRYKTSIQVRASFLIMPTNRSEMINDHV